MSPHVLMNAANSQNVIFAAVNSGGNSHMFSASSCDNNTHSFHYHFVIQVCIIESIKLKILSRDCTNSSQSVNSLAILVHVVSGWNSMC